MIFFLAWSSVLFNRVLVYTKELLSAASCFPVSALGPNVSSQCALAETVTNRLHEK